jgi:ribosomal protein S18 acetylase RimI-like enzyme
MIDVRRASVEEVPALAALIARVFRDEPIHAWTFPTEDLDGLTRAFFEAFDRAVAAQGWLWTAGEGAAVAMWIPPDSREIEAGLEAAAEPTLRSLAADGGERYEAFWAWVESVRPTEPHWYLDHIAVEPERQGEGLGVALVEHGLAMARADGLPAFLVTSSERSVGFYERRGFAVFEEAASPGGGPYLWFMRWDA